MRIAPRCTSKRAPLALAKSHQTHPPPLATCNGRIYGSFSGGVIPGNATLIFEVELLDFVEGGGSTVVPMWLILLLGAAYVWWRILQ